MYAPVTKLATILLIPMLTLATQCVETRTYHIDAGGCSTWCSGSKPHCDVASDTCVECTADAHCSGSEPNCNASTHACFGCTTNADCATSASGSICDVGTHACRACVTDGECGGNVGATACREQTGRCVECTADTEGTKCGGSSCSRTSFTCTTTDLHTVGTCHRCQSDSECVLGDHCVPMVSGQTALGTYCLHDIVANGCGTTNMNPGFLPFSNPTALTSVDCAIVTTCLPRSTISCEAISLAGTGCTLASGTNAQDDSCGNPLIHDGRCATPGLPAPTLCVYTCVNIADCPQGAICNSASPKFCE